MVNEKELRAFGKLICEVADGKYLSREEAKLAYKQIILNEQPELQQGAFLMAHFTRGPSTEELGGAWDALDQYDTEKFKVTLTVPICDIVGTGSDTLKTVNCSSPAALIASACGLAVPKKGAKKVTGVSGASDIFEEFGINLNSPLSKAKECLSKHHICYLPGEAFLKSGWARLIQSMRFTSAFNILGPITFPCENVDYIVIGAYSPNVCDQLIAVLNEIGIKRAVAPYGMAEGIDKNKGMDEFSNIGTTRVVELNNSQIETYMITPKDFGIKTGKYEDIASFENAPDNARAIYKVLNGEYDSPLANLFCINAGACLYISGIAENYKKGFDLAKEAVATKRALKQLEHLKEYQG
jgi:anthranilate phosphoribosyltransferase